MSQYIESEEGKDAEMMLVNRKKGIIYMDITGLYTPIITVDKIKPKM